MKPRFKFSHRAGGRYYWTRRLPGQFIEEQISCDVLWFWGWVSDNPMLPRCDCGKAGTWGVGAWVMPDDNHVLVRVGTHSYLAHKEAACVNR